MTLVAVPLFAASPATAMTSSNVHVVSPTGTYFTFDEVTGPETINVSGTSNGAPGEKIDINCYAGNKRSSLAQEITLGAGGSFSFSGSFFTITKQTCVLRAVPHKDTALLPPGSPTPFTGPTLAIGRRQDAAVESGLNKGTLLLYYIYAPQLGGAFDYRSLGDCSILDSYTFDPTTFAPSRLDACNATFWWQNGASGLPGIAEPKRSELQVDGVNAYLPGNADELFKGAENNPGYPSLKYRYEIEPATGNLLLEESDQLVKCAPQPTVYPPTPSSCSSFVPTGVEAYMGITQGQGGRAAAVTQWFYSTDGAPHQLDLLEQNQFEHVNEDGELEFPWTGEGLTSYATAGQQLPAAPSSPGSFFVKGSESALDGSEQSPQGAVTFSNPPEGETIVGSTLNEVSWVNLHYQRTVPATGAIALGFTYSTAFARAEVERLAAAAQAAYVPSVAISAPANGTSTSQSQVTISGTASDQTALSSLVVNGTSVAVEEGAWSTNVPLKVGSNTITAVVTNVFGHTAQAQTTITYVPAALAPTKATAGGAKADPRGVRFTLTCQAPAGTTCNGVATLTSTEQRRGKRVIAISARRHRKRPQPVLKRVPVIVGEQTFAIPAGQTVSVSVSLNKAGRNLLSRFHKLPVTLAVMMRNGASAAPTLIDQSRLVIKPAPKQHKPRRHHRKHPRRSGRHH
jgi:hypothetical protein